MRMFPGYLDDARRGALDEAALAVQSAGRRELAALRGRAAPLPPPQALLEPAPAAPRLPLPGAGGAELMSAAADAAAEAGMPADVPLWAGHVRRGAQPEARAGGRPGAAQARARDAGLPAEARLRGAAHVCDRVACRLPAADWYKAARQQGAVPAQSGHPALGERKGGFAVPGSPGV
jgi:hypothetical protein